MSIRSFDNLDDMFAEMRRDKQVADNRVQPWQEAVKKGDYFIRDSEIGVPIYGEVLQHAPQRADARQYRFTKCYSILCPEGEMGDIHVSTIRKVIPQNEFEAAKRRGWQV